MSTPIKQYTTVYHEVYGKGSILSITYRRQDNLLFCSFGKGKHGFTTERQLRRGDGEITLTKQRGVSRSRNPESLEEAIRSILGGG